MTFCPEHPKRVQNPKFTPLSETTSIPVPFIWQSPPPGLSGSFILHVTLHCVARSSKKRIKIAVISICHYFVAELAIRCEYTHRVSFSLVSCPGLIGRRYCLTSTSYMTCYCPFSNYFIFDRIMCLKAR